MSNTISLPLNIAKALASMVSFADKDNDTLACVYVQVTPGTVSAMASDRYAIIESIYVERNGDGSLEFGINAEIAKFINSIKTKNSKQDVEFTLEEDSLTVGTLGVSGTFRTYLKDFSKVWSRFSELMETENKPEKATPITLNVALLARCAKLLDYNGAKAERWEFHLGSEERSGKPSPIHAYSGGVISYHLLQQPNLNTKRD